MFVCDVNLEIIIERNFIGVVTEENAQVSESPLARLNFIVEPTLTNITPKKNYLGRFH